MRRKLVPSILALVFLAASAHADTSAEDPLPFLQGLSFVRLETADVPALHRARLAIEAAGGTVAIMSPPSTLIGWIPPSVQREFVASHPLARVYDAAIPAADMPRDEQSEAMAVFFNAAVRGDLSEEERRFREQAPAQKEAARPGDVFDAPPYDESEVAENLVRKGEDLARLQARGIFTPGATSSGNSDAMTGVAAVSLMFMESDGSSTDPDMYTWTPEDMQSYINGVATGLAWWALRASAYSGCHVTWLIYWYSGADPRMQQWTEPILHDTSYEDIWVNEIMANFGYTSGSRWSRVTAFNTAIRAAYQTDRAFTAFIAYNPAGGVFPDGSTAYAYRFGPFSVLVFKATGTPTPQVFDHETGHIFGACDEYASGCSSCTGCSANGITNGNCESCNPNSRECMMRYNVYQLCGYTPGQIGWDGVITPCTPAAPPALPAPVVTSTDFPSIYQGLAGTVTITGTDFFAGAWVDFGSNVFVDVVDVVNSTTIVADVTILGSAPLGPYPVTVTNKDFQSSGVANGLNVIPTTRHYFSPTGGDVYPYITPADAATVLDDAISAAYVGDTLYVPTMTILNADIDITQGVLLYGGWDNTFSTRDLASGKTVLQLTSNVTIFPGADQGGLDGFILENGSGALNSVPYQGYYGGGVRVLDADGIIANCEIHNCDPGPPSALGLGGAIYAQNGTVDIRDNYIWGNSATWGGAMFLTGCSGSVTGNTIENNTAVASTSPAKGSGIYLDACSSMTLGDNVVCGNSGGPDGGAVYASASTGITIQGGELSGNTASSSGGAVAASASQVDLGGTTMSHNHGGTLGGAVSVQAASDVSLTEAILEWNDAALGGAVYAGNADFASNHCLYVGNMGTVTGGALMLASVTTGELSGNTLDRNTSSQAGGMTLSNAPVEVFNNIVANTTGHGIACSGTPPLLSYNIVWNASGDEWNGCTPGAGSGSWDPAFVDTASGDYRLGLHSGAIDAGRPDAMYNDPDGSRGDAGMWGSHAFAMAQPSYVKNLVAGIDGGDVVLTWQANPEADVANYAVYCDTISGFKPGAGNFVALVAAPDTSVNLGAPGDSAWYVVCAVDTSGYAGGYSNESGISPATSAGIPVVTQDYLHRNVPNPFNPSTTIRFDLAAAGMARLVVYDVSGRVVRTLIDGVQNAGPHTATWRGENDDGARVSSGVYFCRLETSRRTSTRKMVLLK